jgi:hypothetical protein
MPFNEFKLLKENTDMLPQVTLRQFMNYQKALDPDLDGITFVDKYNLRVFGITKAQYDAIYACAMAIAPQAPDVMTLMSLNNFLAGKRVAGARAQPNHIEAIEKAFQGKTK